MDLSSIHFHTVAVLAVLLYVVVLSFVVFFVIAWRLARSQKKIFSVSSMPVYLRFAVCGPLAITSMLLAFAGPYRVKDDILKENIGAKVAIALDNSPSMGAVDITEADAAVLRSLGLRPTRLGLCIANLSRAFEGMRGIEIVLFTFSGATDLRTGDWVELTENSFRSFQSVLFDTDSLWSGAGTDISRIFEEARQILKDEPSFFLLCSDGGKAGSGVSEIIVRDKVAKFAYGEKHEYVVPIYTLGTGTEGVAAPIPLFLRDGSIQGFLRVGPEGENVHTEYDPAMMREIARISGGTFQHASGIYSGRDLLRSAIWTGLRRNRNVTVKNPQDLSFPFIFSALIFFTITSGGLSFLKRRKRS